MPFLRFTRDKRGYETTSLVHAPRQGGPQRVLYWFRTPPDVKVGRSPFDKEVTRRIEEANPDVEFDWPTILAAQPSSSQPSVDDRRLRRGRRDGERRRAPAPARAPAVRAPAAPPAAPAPITVEAVAEAPVEGQPLPAPAPGEPRRRRRSRRGGRRHRAGGTPAATEQAATAEPPPEPPPSQGSENE